MKILLYIFILFFSLHSGYSQTHIYKHFGVDEGLPSSEVYDIYQDKQGHIWFATDKGLSRFNGYEFKNYTTEDGLLDNTILDFYPQENGQVWCYGYHSQRLFYFNENFDGFIPYAYNETLKKQLKPSTVLKSVVLDNTETLYAGGYGICGYLEISNKGKASKRFGINLRPDQPFAEQNITLGLQKKRNVLFTACHNYEDEENLTTFKIKNNPTSRLDIAFLNKEESIIIDYKLGLALRNGDVKYYDTNLNPIGIKRFNDHSFFVGYYNNGAEIRDVSGAIIQEFLPKKSVTSFLIDAEGSYWFSTLDDGVFYIKNPSIQVFTDDHIFSLVKDHTNTLYAGYSNGNIARISKKKIDTLYKGLNTNHALVEFDETNNYLYGYSDGKLINYTSQKKSFLVSANNLPEHTGNKILSSNTHSFHTLKNDSIIRYDLNYKIQDVCNYNGATLIGTSSGLFIQKNGHVTAHQSNAILKSRIDDIDVSKKTQKVYMATQGEGVVVYGDSIYNITKEKGLTSNVISEIHIENDSVVWACSNSGLNRITFDKNNNYDITIITKADGLLSNDIDDLEIINDTVWVATKKGMCFFNKDFLVKKTASRILSLTLKNVTVNNTNIETENIKLKHNQNNIDFELQAISHRNTKKIKYLYRLKEIDTNWTTTTNRNIQFPSLAPGNYTFEAKASVLNIVHKDCISYSFKILPPFWKSWWFYSICVLLLSGIIYLFFRIRILTYNQDIIRELIRLAIKRLKRKEQFYNFRSNGEDIKISTHEILYIQSQGNYLDIFTTKKMYTIRCKIGDFINSTPDVLEYLRVHRSYIIRIDQVSSKGKNWVVINDQQIPVGETYLGQLEKIQF